MMVRAESYTPVALDKVRLLFEAARIYQEKLRQDETGQAAVRRGHRARSRARRGRPAARASSTSTTRSGPQLSPVIDMLVRKVGQLHADPRELNELYYRAARTADELGDYRQALQLLQGRLRHRLDVPADAARARRPAVQDGRTGTAPGRSTRPSWSSTATGRTRRTSSASTTGSAWFARPSGERKKALNMFEKALEIDPQPPRHAAGGHRPAAAAGRLGGGGPRQARPDGDRAGQGEGRAARRDRRHLPRASSRTRRRRSRRTSRRSRSRQRRPPAPAEGPRPLHRDQAVEEGGRDHRALHRARERRRSGAARTTTPPRRCAATSSSRSTRRSTTTTRRSTASSRSPERLPEPMMPRALQARSRRSTRC